MKGSMIPRLIWKDWQLHRKTAIASLGTGAVALGVYLNSGKNLLGLLSIVAFFITIVVLSCMIPSACLANERKHHTMAFVMSLPVSPLQYTAAKLASALVLFMLPWLTLVIAGTSIILSRADIPKGLIPVFLALCVLVMAGMSVLAAVSLVAESEGWVILANVGVNVSYSFAWVFIAINAHIKTALQSPTPVWDSTILSMLGGEFAFIALVLGLAFFLQSRKRDFI